MNHRLFLLIIICILSSCSKQSIKQSDNTESKSSDKMEFKISSKSFLNEGNIPSLYTCDSENISPYLNWSCKYKNVKSYALIMDDPDAPSGDFVHWIVFNIPYTVTELPENFSPGIYPFGKNGFGKQSYGGPCPPSGVHRYVFKLYALDKILDLNPGISKKEILDAMDNHIIAKTELTGKYQKK